jgi:hypothetical protein
MQQRDAAGRAAEMDAWKDALAGSKPLQSGRFCRNFYLRRFAVCSPAVSNGAS